MRLPGLFDLSLGGKLALSFGVVVALLVAVAVTSLVSLSSLTSATHQITRSSDERVQAAQEIKYAAAEMQSAQFTYVMAHGQFGTASPRRPATSATGWASSDAWRSLAPTRSSWAR